MEVSEYLNQDLKNVTKAKPADRVVMSKLTRQSNRNDFLTRKRQISDSPLPKMPQPVKQPQVDTKKEESKRRLEQLKKWQQERDKRKREEQSKKKPIFKVYHVDHAPSHKFRPPKNVRPISLKNSDKKGDAVDGGRREPASRKQLNFGSDGAGVVTRSQAKKQHLNEAESQAVKKAANMETGKSVKYKLGKNVSTQNKNAIKTTAPKTDNQKKGTSIKSKAAPKPAAKPPPKTLKTTRNTKAETRSKVTEEKVHTYTDEGGNSPEKLEVFTSKVAAKTPLKTSRGTRSKVAEEKVDTNVEESNSSEDIEKMSMPSVKELVKRFSGVPEPSEDLANGKIQSSASKVPKIEIKSESVSTGPGSSSSSLSTEYPISHSVFTPKSDSTTPEDANRSGTYSEAPDVTGVKAGAEYFHNVLDGEILRIENMCEEWNKYKNDTDPPEEACNMINVATGQSQLLITKRMKQFRGLICSCEAQNSDPPITCEDLHGNWDLLQIVVRNLDSRFEILVRLRDSNWEEVIPEKKAKEPVRRKKKAPVKTKSSSSIREAIKAARMKKMQGGGGDESESVSTGPGSSSSSLSTEYPMSHSVFTPKSDSTTPEDANRSGTYSEAPDVTGVKAGAEYFHNVLDGEILRIENMCEEWNKYKNDTDPPEEACNMINVATGQSQLLITKRMKQFRGLICSCEAQNSDPPITCEDLHGNWDLLQIVVRNLDSRFEILVRLRDSNWEEVIPEKKAKEPVRRKKKAPVKTKSSSSIREAIKAARMKKMQGGGGDESESVSTGPGSSSSSLSTEYPMSHSVFTPKSDSTTPEDANRSGTYSEAPDVTGVKAGAEYFHNVLDGEILRIENMCEEWNKYKYMRAVLANSRDISRLLRSINTNTGMCVGTSLDRNLTVKTTPSVTDEITAHPWVDANLDNDRLLSDVDDFDLTTYLNEDLVPNQPAMSPTNSLDDHTYTMNNGRLAPESDEVGVCLHISNRRVALEFCGTCNENAQQIWTNEEEESSYK